jgi:hypothetical protein
MTHTETVEVAGSILTFIGGVLLVIDAFSPVRGLYLQGGDEKWKWLLSKIGSQAQKVADPGPPPNDKEALVHAQHSQWLTRGGFIVVTLGFLCDMAAKLHWL